jgi:hypothetical protein
MLVMQPSADNNTICFCAYLQGGCLPCSDVPENNNVSRFAVTSTVVQVAKGARDFLPDQMAIREAAFGIITSVFKRHGESSTSAAVYGVAMLQQQQQQPLQL